jgi:hypothetical protein
MTGQDIQFPYAPPPSLLNDNGRASEVMVNGSEETIFNALIKGKLTWSLESTMRLDHRRFLLYYKELNDVRERCLNLRNYLLRESKHPQANAFVL